jgi:hopanoid biosynthesis associated radical SAM protein HpnH
MRFPLSLTRSLTGYLLRKRLRGEKRFPLVLMLEPLFACNLSCAGCGRVREYADAVHRRMTVDECLASVDECGAPVVSICGGEPLIYEGIASLTASVVARGKHVYLCTNGLRLAEMLGGFRPSTRLFFNVHLDGMEATHDRAVQRDGVFRKAVDGIVAAKKAGFQVCSNTTIYKETDMNEVVVLLEYLTQLGVDGFILSPSYGYEAVRCDAALEADRLFMVREEAHEKLRSVRGRLERFRLMSSPIYLDFLCGRRTLDCAAWANPTRNVVGWKGPCYLVTDAHYPTFRELIEATRWDTLGPGRDPRCAHCLMHCGFEPAAVLAANRHLRDAWTMAKWQLT